MDSEPLILGKKETKNKPVKSFETEKGSAYIYDKNGKVDRFKTVEQKWQEQMDITIFASPNSNDKRHIFDAYTKPDKFSFHILEIQGGKNPTSIYGLEDVKNPDNLKFGVLNIPKNKWAFTGKASLTPTIGAIVYEQGKSKKDENRYRFHLGHEVTKINY